MKTVSRLRQKNPHSIASNQSESAYNEYPARLMEAFAVSNFVTAPKNDFPKIISRSY